MKHQRAEPHSRRALERGREEKPGRGREAERRAVMLGDVIGVEAGVLAMLDDAQPRRIEIAQGSAHRVSIWSKTPKSIAKLLAGTRALLA